jgi:hypothetical protein
MYNGYQRCRYGHGLAWILGFRLGESLESISRQFRLQARITTTSNLLVWLSLISGQVDLDSGHQRRKVGRKEWQLLAGLLLTQLDGLV